MLPAQRVRGAVNVILQKLAGVTLPIASRFERVDVGSQVYYTWNDFEHHLVTLAQANRFVEMYPRFAEFGWYAEAAGEELKRAPATLTCMYADLAAGREPGTANAKYHETAIAYACAMRGVSLAEWQAFVPDRNGLRSAPAAVVEASLDARLEEPPGEVVNHSVAGAEAPPSG